MTLRNCPICGNHDLLFYSQGMARQNEIEVWFIEKPERIIECNIIAVTRIMGGEK